MVHQSVKNSMKKDASEKKKHTHYGQPTIFTTTQHEETCKDHAIGEKLHACDGLGYISYP